MYLLFCSKCRNRTFTCKYANSFYISVAYGWNRGDDVKKSWFVWIKIRNLRISKPIELVYADSVTPRPSVACCLAYCFCVMPVRGPMYSRDSGVSARQVLQWLSHGQSLLRLLTFERMVFVSPLLDNLILLQWKYYLDFIRSVFLHQVMGNQRVDSCLVYLTI